MNEAAGTKRAATGAGLETSCKGPQQHRARPLFIAWTATAWRLFRATTPYRTREALLQADAACTACASVTRYGMYSSALATGSLPHPLGVQFASIEPPTLRT